MRARDLAEDLPTVDLNTDAMDAARTLARHRIPGLVVMDEDGSPYAVLPGSQVLRFVIPSYVQDDLQLAAVYDELAVDELCAQLQGRPVRDLLPKRQQGDDLSVVEGDANMMEVAALVARLRSPLVGVVDDGVYVGAITVSRLLQHLVPEKAQ